ncbi:MAG TPA: aminotransferase class V-fold PLP-dependent enzyme [Vicinamibacterales bacterium]|nr:aminotransferase class V-fold PLP-dependent enzyme [Vicinamibacterales bacterium]
MPLNRRELLTGLGAAAASAAISDTPAGAAPAAGSAAFPRKADFAFEKGTTYISGAFTHPMPIAAADAYRDFVTRRGTVGATTPFGGSRAGADPKAAFAALINAKPSEIGYIANTSTGENLVVECLGITKFDGNVVTDALHFEGALVHLMELRKQGLDLRVVAPRDGKIQIADLERVVDRKTKLVEVSLVSMYNGFQHDLKAVCDLAHAHGAYVYADIIQAAGAVPIDVQASNVDFAACATYKWLMGDFGLGFFYVREDLLGRMVQRPHWSYRSAADVDIHISPFDPESPAPVTWKPRDDAAGFFELGTVANAVAAALGVSLPYIQRLGVEEIQKYRQPMLKRLQQEMPRLGFTAATPLDSTSPIVTFASRDTREAARKLDAARVNVRVAPYWIRIAPSIYNDMRDVDRLLDALA